MRYRYRCTDCGEDSIGCIYETDIEPDDIGFDCPQGGPATWDLICELEEEI
jgi:hypothetical protein